jgi:MFS family permease
MPLPSIFHHRARVPVATSSVSVPSYRALLQAPGNLDFVIPGLIGRLPLAMRSLGCVLLIQGYTGSFGVAGAIGAVHTIVSALAGPRLGQLADRRSHRQVLLVTMLVQALTTFALIALAANDGSVVLEVIVAFLLGASAMPFPSMSRAIWSARVERGPVLERAFTIESIFDQVAFILGPFAVILLAVKVTPGGGLIGALLMTIIASLGFMRLDDIRAEPITETSDKRQAIQIRGLQILILAFIGMGILYGANEVGIVAFAEEQGHPGAASVLVSFFAGGALFGALAYGAHTWRSSAVKRTVIAIGWVWLAMLPIVLAPNLWWCGVAILICGFAISPGEISAFTIVEQIIPDTARTEGFSWIIAGISLGAALGAMFGGMAIDASGARAGLLVSFGGGTLAFLSLLLGAKILSRPYPGHELATAPADD